eukprot:TRINITY_DN25695_c0_g1_i1.p1 TRINITY_DN25695_c0_g1~~TRINITY_DN25695_c0_g1_i1.p1  ORF type:complete len:397 (+),score=64.34 TRINITY_DN25695_c0_g1_i1:31-1191(+)
MVSGWGFTKLCCRDRKSDFRKLLSADDVIEKSECRGSAAYDLNLPGSDSYDPLEVKASNICSCRPTTIDAISTDIGFPVGGRWLENEDGSKLFYSATGESDPEEYLLLLHGINDYSAMWERFTERVLEQPHKKKLRLISVDFYGRGRSVRENISSDKFDIEYYCKQAYDVLVATGAVDHIFCKLPPPGAFPYPKSRPRLTVVGHQIGAAVAAHFAVTHPKLVSRVVLCSPVGVPGSVSKVMQLAATVGFPCSLFSVLSRIHGGPFRQSKTSPSADLSDKHAEIQDKNPGLIPSIIGTLRDFPFEGLSDTFQSLGTHKHIRVLLLWGRRDPVNPFHHSTEVRSLIGKQCALYGIDAAANVVLESPEVSAARLIAFLASDEESLTWKG